MVRDAESYAAKDKERKAQIEAKNEAEAVIYSAEKSVSEYKDKVSSLNVAGPASLGFQKVYKRSLSNMPGLQVPQSVSDDVNSEIANVRSSLDQPAEEIKSKIQALQKALMKIGESMQQPGTSTGGGSESSESTSAGTYDADVKDEKK